MVCLFVVAKCFWSSEQGIKKFVMNDMIVAWPKVKNIRNQIKIVNKDVYKNEVYDVSA